MGSIVTTSPRFIVDDNVGKLAKWLRIMGYDTLFFHSTDDAELISIALAQGRTILTKDSQLMRRRVITSGRLRAILIKADDIEDQLRQVMDTLGLDYDFRPFSLCLECNRPLLSRTREEVRDLVPAFVFQTQHQYMQCPACSRIYWRGTHWQRMSRELERTRRGGEK